MNKLRMEFLSLCTCRSTDMTYHRTIELKDGTCKYCGYYVFHGTDNDLPSINATESQRIYSEELVSLIRDDYENGMSILKCSEKYSISRETISGWKNNQDWDTRNQAQVRHNLTPEQIQDIGDYYKETKNISKTARKFGRSRSVIYGLAERFGWKERKKHYSEDFKKKVVRYFEKCLDKKKVADKYDISTTSVTSWVKKYGKKETEQKYQKSLAEKKEPEISEKLIRKIRMKYENGESLLSLTKKYDVDYGKMNTIRKKNKWKKATVGLSKEKLKEVEIELRKPENTLGDVAKMFNVSTFTIFQLGKKWGIRKPKTKREVLLETARDMLSKDIKASQIADKLGVSETTIYRWKKDWNL